MTTINGQQVQLVAARADEESWGIRQVWRDSGNLGSWVTPNGWSTSPDFGTPYLWPDKASAEAYVAGYEDARRDVLRFIGAVTGEEE